jgi:hypothetical protein
MQTHIKVYISTICNQDIDKVHNGKCIQLCNNQLLMLYYKQLLIESNMIKIYGFYSLVHGLISKRNRKRCCWVAILVLLA